jgi:flagellar biosynthesis/type III secretory pathway protein FliH
MTTAVEFLLEKYKSQNTLLFAEDFEQAIEMFEQQIIDAYDQGSEAGYEKAKNDDFIEGFKMKEAEQYYNETFS